MEAAGAEKAHVRGEKKKNVVSCAADARKERELDVGERERGRKSVLGGDGGGRLDTLEVGLDCALDYGELVVAHFFVFGEKKDI